MNLHEIERTTGRLIRGERLGVDGLVFVVVAAAASLGLAWVTLEAASKAPFFALLCGALSIGFMGMAAQLAVSRQSWEIDAERRVFRQQSRALLTRGGGIGATREETLAFDAFDAVEVWRQGGVMGGQTIVRTLVGLVGDPTRIVLAATANAYQAHELAAEVSELTGLPVRDLTDPTPA